MSISRAIVAVAALLCARPALAQEKPEYLLKKEQTNKRPDEPCNCASVTAPAPPAEPVEPSPWTFRFRLGSVFQISQNRSVVGRLDGTSRSFQADVHGEANWACGKHEVRNRLDTNTVIVKTQNTGQIGRAHV